MTDTPDDTDVPTTECRVCKIDVPDGKYCGLCGVPIDKERGDGPEWLRLSASCVAPDEHLLRPSIASSLFPHLSHQSRMPFRIAMLVLLAGLVACALLRLPAALIAVAALGLPLLFLLYLYESDAFRDLHRVNLAVAIVLGVALGVGWVLLTGHAMAKSYGVPLGVGVTGSRMVRNGLGIPLGGAVLMLVPAVVVRVLRPASRESLDGFMIGALGATAFTAAATLTRLAPQLTTGMVARNRPMSGLIVEAGIRGVAVPLTAAAIGGLIGAALWFTRPATKADKHVGYVRLVMFSCAFAVLIIYTALGLVDVARIPQWIQLAVHIGVALLAILALRVGLHLALLHEAQDEIASDQPIFCPRCGHVVPDMSFCPHCGAATHASSRTSRAERREHRPVRDPGAGTG
ncbi:zinc ribbon domain-containing protein [Mycolicibacterium septicum DSM 44393]|uniref:Zinc ribbon domain-containing protein n=1 Tax=Mycolicibacterium septicum DSM 44393 TaxID=1341646 RepID=A0A7X6RY80_9MYCO|nr:zinc ribbon domain-containing protein [Mycolicibacterium septicum]NKZ13416.1 zinc ribbon domain-containing protein [Mycolicibacterium septicum DSM 44393]